MDEIQLQQESSSEMRDVDYPSGVSIKANSKVTKLVVWLRDRKGTFSDH